MADFNAQLGARPSKNEYILGNFSHEKRSANEQYIKNEHRK